MWKISIKLPRELWSCHSERGGWLYSVALSNHSYSSHMLQSLDEDCPKKVSTEKPSLAFLIHSLHDLSVSVTWIEGCLFQLIHIMKTLDFGSGAFVWFVQTHSLNLVNFYCAFLFTLYSHIAVSKSQNLIQYRHC